MRCVSPLLLLGLWGSGQAEGVAPRTDTCSQAIVDYEASARGADSQERVRRACYPGPGRVPVPREPISVDGTAKDAARLPSPPPPVISLPKSPPVLTLCDTGGCWDNLGNRYSGTGTVLYGPGGAPCTRSGDRIDCR